MFIPNKTQRLRKQAQNEPTSHASFGACIHFKMKQITINSVTNTKIKRRLTKSTMFTKE